MLIILLVKLTNLRYGYHGIMTPAWVTVWFIIRFTVAEFDPTKGLKLLPLWWTDNYIVESCVRYILHLRKLIDISKVRY